MLAQAPGGVAGQRVTLTGNSQIHLSPELCVTATVTRVLAPEHLGGDCELTIEMHYQLLSQDQSSLACSQIPFFF